MFSETISSPLSSTSIVLHFKYRHNSSPVSRGYLFFDALSFNLDTTRWFEMDDYALLLDRNIGPVVCSVIGGVCCGHGVGCRDLVDRLVIANQYLNTFTILYLSRIPVIY